MVTAMVTNIMTMSALIRPSRVEWTPQEQNCKQKNILDEQKNSLNVQEKLQSIFKACRIFISDPTLKKKE